MEIYIFYSTGGNGFIAKLCIALPHFCHFGILWAAIYFCITSPKLCQKQRKKWQSFDKVYGKDWAKLCKKYIAAHEILKWQKCGKVMQRYAKFAKEIQGNAMFCK